MTVGIAGDTKTCPRCAEDVKAAAKVCRYCGHEFAEATPVSLEKHRPAVGEPSADSSGATPAERHAAGPTTTMALGAPESDGSASDRTPRRRNWPIVAGAFGALLAALAIGYAMSPSLPQHPAVPGASPAPIATPGPALPNYPALADGQTLEWEADKADVMTDRQAGPYLLHVTKRIDGDGTAPVVTVTQGAGSVTMTCEAVPDSYTHRISLIPAGTGGSQMVMLESFTGGAHCCNHIQVATSVDGALRVIDLGTFDGEQIAMPTDVDGDGRPDFVVVDNDFLYAFTPYAMSAAPPRFIDIVDGRVVDVSARPQFRRAFLSDMARIGETCRSDDDGANRNGACAAYVADAARTGRLPQAWTEMLHAYAADERWDYPTGCRIRTKGECPENLKIAYNGYPDALLAFLKRKGYVALGWVPPETMPADQTANGIDAPPATQF